MEALQVVASRSLLNEQMQRLHKEMQAPIVLAIASAETSKAKTESRDSSARQREGEKKISEEVRTYTLTYYNPELKKADVIEAKSELKMADAGKLAIEEAVGMRSIYPVYQFMGAPILGQQILPWEVDRILSELEYGTPPPSGAGAAVTPASRIAQSEAELEARKKRDEDVRVALSQLIVRKEQSELRMEEQIVVLEEVVAAIRKGDDLEKQINSLPPLSRLRYLVALRKARVGRQLVVEMLLRDVSFLKSIKKTLETLGREDLVNLVKMLGALAKKK